MTKKHKSSTAPRLGRVILKGIVSKSHSEVLIGDLEEEFTEIRSKQGINKAKIWYWKEVALAVQLQAHDLARPLIRTLGKWLNRVKLDSSRQVKEFTDSRPELIKLPPFGVFILELILTEEEAQNVIGCLSEEYEEKVIKIGVHKANAWYWLQVRGSVWSFIYEAIKENLLDSWSFIRRAINDRPDYSFYSASTVERALRHYIQPTCQTIDPSSGEEPHYVLGVRAKLFDVLDQALSHSTQCRYFILLADSGMGKTSALLNYYVRHARRWKQQYNLALIPLGIPDAEKRIASIQNKGTTVLLLDALDEDPHARVDYAERVHLLLRATEDFYRVVVSCRTHFFPKDEEIPRSTGTIKFNADAEDNVAEHFIQKIYLSPFTHEEAKYYLRLRYPFWQLVNRRRAIRIIEKIPYLAVRPMLLAHIDNIMRARRAVNFAFELYELMIEGWLQREATGIGEKDNLREFSERLAVNLYLNRATRGAESIPKPELSDLSEKWNFQLDDWKLGGRSLLNRDSIGNYKFAHRSIMEYLFVKRFMRGERQCLEVEWTDQMRSFFLEMLEKHVSVSKTLPFHDPATDVSSMALKGAEIRFLQDIAAHGLAYLGQKFISNPRANSLLTTLMALCTLMLNPQGHVSMRATLWFVKKDSYRVIPLATYAQKDIEDHHAMFIFNDPANIEMIIESTRPEVATLRSIAGRFVMCMPIVRPGRQNYMLTFESHQIDNINYDYLPSIHDVFEHIPDYL